MRQTNTVKYTECVGHKMTLAFNKRLVKLVKDIGCKFGVDGMIRLPKEMEVYILDTTCYPYKMKKVFIYRLTAEMQVVDYSGNIYLPEMLRVFDWERILRMLENNHLKNRKNEEIMD